MNGRKAIHVSFLWRVCLTSDKIYPLIQSLFCSLPLGKLTQVLDEELASDRRGFSRKGSVCAVSNCGLITPLAEATTILEEKFGFRPAVWLSALRRCRNIVVKSGLVQSGSKDLYFPAGTGNFQVIWSNLSNGWKLFP